MIADVLHRADQRVEAVRPQRTCPRHHVLGPQQDVCEIAHRRLPARRVNGHAVADRDSRNVAGGFDDLRRQQIRIAEKIRHEGVGRRFVERTRRADLRDAGLMHHHDDVGHGQGLGLVVRDVDDGGADGAMDALDLDLHLLAQLLVQRAERLIHQQQARPRNQRARHRHALLLAARELARIALRKMRELHQREHLGDARMRRFARELRAHAQREADIVRHRHVRKQRVGLEHHADIALVRRHVGDRALVEQDVAGIGSDEAGDQIERGGLARSARAQQRHECAGRHVERDAVDRLHRTERLGEIAQPELRSACTCRGSGFTHRRRYPRYAAGRLRSEPNPCPRTIPSPCGKINPPYPARMARNAILACLSRRKLLRCAARSGARTGRQ